MKHLVERLRSTPECVITQGEQEIADLCDEAADEIEFLRKRILELESQEK
jgi:hypothetical protein